MSITHGSNQASVDPLIQPQGAFVKKVYVRGVGSGVWVSGDIEVPAGAEIEFRTFRNTGGCTPSWVCGRMTCIADPDAAPLRISGHECCGRALAIEGRMRVLQHDPDMILQVEPASGVLQSPCDIEVFDGVLVRFDGRFARYVRTCSICGEETVTGTAPVAWRYVAGSAEGMLAVLLSSTLRGGIPDMASLMREAPPAASPCDDPLHAQHRATSAWLRWTLGRSRHDILLSLEAMANVPAADPFGPVGRIDGTAAVNISSARADPSLFNLHAVGRSAAMQLVLPALAALTASCAEYDALENAIFREFTRRAGSARTAYEEALAYVRAAVEVLQSPHRYVL